MNEQSILTDATLEAMLARRAGSGAPADLLGSITAGLDALPAERRPWWSVLLPPIDRSPAIRLAWILAMVGLLLTAAVSALFVGNELLRRSSEPVSVMPRVILTLSHPDGVTAVAWSPDGTLLATGASHTEGNADADWPVGTARIWDAVTGEQTLVLEQKDTGIGRITYSLDGTRLIIPGFNPAVYDATTGEVYPDQVSGFLALSPDGTRVAAGGAWGWAAIVDATTGDELLTLRGHPSWVSTAAWSPDGTRLATTWGNTTKIWDTINGEELVQTKGYLAVPHKVTAITWSPDGTRLATASDDEQTVSVWDAVTGDELLTLTGHAGGIEAVAWSRDGAQIATASQDGTARLWEAATGLELANLTGHAGGLTDLAWSPDGSRLATASLDGTARIWQVADAPRPTSSPSPSRTSRPSPTTAATLTAEGTDSLAVTTAMPLPAEATCPPGSNPDTPGPAGEGHRPNEYAAMAFDRHAGRIVALGADSKGRLRTWTFDVCTNTWQRMNPPEVPPSTGPVALVYDADSDRTVAVNDHGRVWSYDLAADRWTQGTVFPGAGSLAGWTNGVAAAYHDPSGLVVVYDGQSMWAYDVETDTFTAVRQLPDPLQPADAGLPDGVTAVVYDRDRDLFRAVVAVPADLRDSGFVTTESRAFRSWVADAVLEIWAFDPGDSIWRLQPPHVPAGVLWQQDGFFYGPVSRVTFDEATGATVFMSSGGQVEADDGQTSWRAFPVDGEPVNPSGSRCDSLAPVYDPLNGRIVCLVGDGGVSSFSMAAGEWRWLLEPSGSDTAVGTIERPGGD